MLNTGVILRERRYGKRVWSGIHLKLQLAEQLAFLGRPVLTANVGIDENSDCSEPEISPQKMRLSRNIVHVPGVLPKRNACCVHRQRKTTKKMCTTCDKAICSSYCWALFHSKRNYLFDDKDCAGKVIRNRVAE